DSVALIVRTVTDAFTAIDEPVPTETAIRSISGLSLNVAMQVLAPAASPERAGQIVESYRAHYHRGAGVEAKPLFAGALAALDRLQQRPDTILAGASRKGDRGAVSLLARHAILDRCRSVQAPEHDRGKPDPQKIETAMEKAGAGKSETVMIGDTVHDMRMAKAAGVQAIGVAWG